MGDRRAPRTIFVTVVVRTGISISDMCLSVLVAPVEDALPPDVHVAGEQDQEEENQLDEARPPQLAQRERPRIEERDLDVEQEEDHRDQVELHRVPFAGVADRRHAAFVRRELFRRRTLRANQLAEADVEHGKAGAEPNHDQNRKPAVHYLPERLRPLDSPTRSRASLVRIALGTDGSVGITLVNLFSTAQPPNAITIVLT